MAKSVKIIIVGIASCLGIISCSNKSKEMTDCLVPIPYQIESNSGTFEYTEPTVIFQNIDSTEEENVLFRYIREMYPNAKMAESESGKGSIKLILDKNANVIKDSYKLQISSDAVEIRASNHGGIFYGIVDLMQLFHINEGTLPATRISDMPLFEFRLIYLDVASTFLDKHYIKKMLRMMSYYKLNYLALGINNPSAWRVEINSRPRLIEYSAYRPYENFYDWENGGKSFCFTYSPMAVGGYYTKTDIKEIIAYAKECNITIIPSIDIRLQSNALFNAYPDILGIYNSNEDRIICPGKEETYRLFDDIIDEISELFESEYIHFTCIKTDNFKPQDCLKCRKKMQEEDIKTADNLKSYYLERIINYVHERGKISILDNNIAGYNKSKKETVIMASESVDSSINIAKKGIKVILSPNDRCILNEYQGDPTREPKTTAGYTPIEKLNTFFSPSVDVRREEIGNILGIAGKFFTNDVKDPANAEYLLYPRLLALAETSWSIPYNKSLERFTLALNSQYKILSEENINAKSLSKDIYISDYVDLKNKQIEVSLKCNKKPSEIRYTRDGSEPNNNSTLFRSPIKVVDSATIKAAIFDKDKKISDTETFKRYYHKAIGKSVKYNTPYSSYLVANKEKTLTDGYIGSFSYTDGFWQSFKDSLNVTIDMGEETDINEITGRFLQQLTDNIIFPNIVKIYISSDGKNFSLVKHIEKDYPNTYRSIRFKNFEYTGSISGRYIKYSAYLNSKAAGIMLLDEIMIK